MVSIQIDASGRTYYASRLNYYTVEKVGNEELYVDYDMVSVRYKLDNYDRIVYMESRYLPYHQHGELQVYTGANAAGAITVMSGSLLNSFVADLVDLYKFVYHSPNDNNQKRKTPPTTESKPTPSRPKCKKCSRDLGDELYCPYCGTKTPHAPSGEWHVVCQKCSKELPSNCLDAQNVHCIYCGSKRIKYLRKWQ